MREQEVSQSTQRIWWIYCVVPLWSTVYIWSGQLPCHCWQLYQSLIISWEGRVALHSTWLPHAPSYTHPSSHAACRVLLNSSGCWTALQLSSMANRMEGEEEEEGRTGEEYLTLQTRSQEFVCPNSHQTHERLTRA